MIWRPWSKDVHLHIAKIKGSCWSLRVQEDAESYDAGDGEGNGGEETEDILHARDGVMHC